MKRLTVLGRELVQLDQAGYELERNRYVQLVGVTASPGKWTSSSGLTFKKLYDVLDQIKGEDDINEVVRSLKERSGRM